MRGFFALLVLPTGLMGIGLFLTPNAMRTLWPWMLTPLTARAVGAWLSAIATISAQMAFENDLERVRPGLITMTALGVLQVVALLRYTADFRWTSVVGEVYLLILTGILLMGLYGWLLLRRTC